LAILVVVVTDYAKLAKLKKLAYDEAVGSNARLDPRLVVTAFGSTGSGPITPTEDDIAEDNGCSLTVEKL
jgi:hypothetical protein